MSQDTDCKAKRLTGGGSNIQVFNVKMAVEPEVSSRFTTGI